jgi:polyisoprenyl-teichoic acid--peptidoglycan teichoic acid transferase
MINPLALRWPPTAALSFLALLATTIFITLSGCGPSVLPAELPTRMATAVVITATPSPTPEEAATSTITTRPAEAADLDETATPSPPNVTNTATPRPTITPIPSRTPTSEPLEAPILPTVPGNPTDLGGVVITVSETITRFLPIPTAVPTFAISSGITNILLLGRDESLAQENARTDAIIIVSIDRDNKTAAMLSIPRDTLIYQPNRVMGKINTATRNGGVELLQQAILYNFGVPIHYYAEIDFEGFKQVIDIIGGIEMAVSCQLTDWRLISPELDPTEEDNWERYTLTAGVHQMDGDLALWYARSRLSTSDFDRGRRQQQLLRAIFNTGLDLNLLPQVPTLYNSFNQMVATDLDIGRILQLAAIAQAVRDNGIQHLYLAGRGESMTANPYGYLILPIWEEDEEEEESSGRGMAEVFAQLFQPPALNRATRAPLYVEIINGTGNPDMARLAADNLAWYGFVPIISDPAPDPVALTRLELFAQNDKGAFPRLLAWIFGRWAGHIQIVPDTPYEYNYRVTLGQDYNPCLNMFYAPQS